MPALSGSEMLRGYAKLSKQERQTLMAVAQFLVEIRKAGLTPARLVQIIVATHRAAQEISRR